jgi:aspartate/methionine/tyrosine aminotransferase
VIDMRAGLRKPPRHVLYSAAARCYSADRAIHKPPAGRKETTMRIEPFRMERMQSRFEHYVECNLSESGVLPMSPGDLLEGEGGAARFLEMKLGYGQSNGSEQLRDRIAQFYEGASRANILVTNGGSEANYATCWSLLERGDRVAYMIPNYFQTWGLSRAYAGRADAFRLKRPRGSRGARWALDVEGLRRAVGRKTRLIVVTNPNNPTGAVLSEEEMDEVVRAARRVGAWILADEIYRGAELSGRTTPSFWGRYSRVLITSGLSKAFGLPGLRIGWVAGPPHIIERLWSYRDYTTIAPGTLSDHLACIAMEPRRREAILSRTRTIVRRNLPVLEEWFQRHGDLFDYTAPVAGAIAFPRYSMPIGSHALTEKLRLERSVLIVPGSQLGVERHIRIGYGYDPQALRTGLQRIDRTLEELRRAPRQGKPRTATSRPGDSRRPAARRGGGRRRAAALSRSLPR